MGIESPETLSPKDENEKNASRESSDAELIEGGAEMKGDRLELTIEQLESIASNQEWADMSEHASKLAEELRPYLDDYKHLKGHIEGGIITDEASKELESEIDNHMNDLSKILYSILREDPPNSDEDISKLVGEDTFSALKNKEEEVKDAFSRMDARLGILREEKD